MPDENPSGLGTFDLPLRLPGQYFDKETNVHYNYYRSYDPSIGRYGESDPIGLHGGLNTYAYVLGSPLHLSDYYGLASDSVARGPWWPEKPTSDQVQKAVRDAIKKGRICLKPGEDCSKLHDSAYKLCTGMFANAGAVVCKIYADETATSCILNPDLSVPEERCRLRSAAHRSELDINGRKLMQRKSWIVIMAVFLLVGVAVGWLTAGRLAAKDSERYTMDALSYARHAQAKERASLVRLLESKEVQKAEDLLYTVLTGNFDLPPFVVPRVG